MEEKFKDLSPELTVARAKEILTSLGLRMHEEWLQGTEHLYSMRLTCEELGWGTNGKGTDASYCAASAYGEAMERLANLHLPDERMRLVSAEAKAYRGFELFPDETKAGLQEIERLCPKVWEDMADSFMDSDGHMPNREELLDVWEQWLGGEETVFVPFKRVKEGGQVLLPYEVLRRLCRSNGLAAGNTREEALCQALSEVLERYVQERIFIEELTPPVVPETYLRQCHPTLWQMVQEVEAKGEYHLLVMDGSLGKGLPVVCVVMIDRKKQRYRIKFGAHPLFQIALERCLTELAQGSDFSEESSEQLMTAWTREGQKNWDTLYNWSIVHRRNEGSMPSAILGAQPSWVFQVWEGQTSFNNRDGVNHLLEMCLSLAPEVYIREHSYLGFSAFRVYVPGVSPTHKFHPLGYRTLEMEKWKEILDHLSLYGDDLTEEEKRDLADCLGKDHLHSLTERLPVTENVLMGALYTDLGEWEAATRMLRKETKPTVYVRAVIRELEMCADGLKQEDRDHMLTLFFGKKVQRYVAMNWRGKNVTGALCDPYHVNRMRGRKPQDPRMQMAEAMSRLYCRIKDAMAKEYFWDPE